MIAAVRRAVAGLARIGYTGACITTLAFAATPVHAQSVHIDATAFTLDSNYYQQAATLASDSDGITLIALNDVAALMGTAWSWQWVHQYEGTLHLAPRQDHEITGYTLSGAYQGEFRIGQVPPGSSRPVQARSASATEKSRFRSRQSRRIRGPAATFCPP